MQKWINLFSDMANPAQVIYAQNQNAGMYAPAAHLPPKYEIPPGYRGTLNPQPK